MERPDFNCIKYDTQTEIEDLRLYTKDLNEYVNFLEEERNKQLALCKVGRSLPTEEEVNFELSYLLESEFEASELDAKKEYRFGFRKCYFWLKYRYNQR